MTENTVNRAKWKENVILVDADYVDKVVFNLTVNFERMLERHIPQADMAMWADCVALDGGLRLGDNEIQVVLIHSKEKEEFDNFNPSNFALEYIGKAFKDHIGEFIFSAYPVEDELVSYGDYFAQSMQYIASQEEVKRLMVIPNAEDEDIYNKVRAGLRQMDGDKDITLYTMQPTAGGKYKQEMLGLSIMAALKITSEEIKNKIK